MRSTTVLSPSPLTTTSAPVSSRQRSGSATHTEFLELADKLLVAEALRLTGGNQTHAAKLLGLTRPTLQAKMQKYGLRRQTDIVEE